VLSDIWIASMTRNVRVLDEYPPQFDGGSTLARCGLARRRGRGGSRSIGATNEQEGRPHQRAQLPIRHDASTYVPTTLGRIEVCIHSRRSSRFRRSQDVGIILHLYGALVLPGREHANTPELRKE
jgi:hypothetical protein